MDESAEHPTSPGSTHVKVRFALVPEEDGWPPVSSEGLWAEPLGGVQHRIDNTPWFARNLAADDVVEVLAGSDGVLWATARVTWSGRLTIRVIPFRSGPLAGSLQAVLDAFKPLGVSGEGAQPAYAIVALDVPAEVDWAPVKALLKSGESDGSWSFEEGCVCDRWLDL